MPTEFKVTMLLTHAVKEYSVLKCYELHGDHIAERNSPVLAILVTQLMPGISPWASYVVGCALPSWGIWAQTLSYALIK